MSRKSKADRRAILTQRDERRRRRDDSSDEEVEASGVTRWSPLYDLSSGLREELDIARPYERRYRDARGEPRKAAVKAAVTTTNNKIVVAAIDFGTTYSGYAFSFKHEYDTNPLTMHANEWKNVTQGNMNAKTPTCLLLEPNRKLHSFGIEAKTKYTSLCEENKHTDWYFFWEFKMTLHHEKEIKGNYQLTEENGKKLDALTVFSLSIKAMKDHLIKVLQNGFQGVRDSDVMWVITVPAIWNDSAKKFMRLAAEKAGIQKDSIEIALEPEAASIFCRLLPITRDPQTATGMTKFPSGTRYMILDCGESQCGKDMNRRSDKGARQKRLPDDAGHKGLQADRFTAGLRNSSSSVHKELSKMSIKTRQTFGSDGIVAPTPNGNIIVAAIDFGTTYSGYAFSFKHDFDTNPLKIHGNEWQNASQGQMNAKQPTCLLLTPNRKLHSFGSEAKTKYFALSEANEHTDWYFFWEFKMTLHQEKEIQGNYQLTADNGKKLDALTVFSLSIRYLKEHLLEVLHRSFSGMEDRDITWVITVPAIWNDSAKKFMRKAAEMAGIQKSRIEIALEPEAASIYCRQLPITRDPQTESGMTKFPAGTRYLILDCGGGTVDVTVHEVLEDNNLKELHKATGGRWGGNVINEAFLSFLSKLVGAEVFEDFSTTHKSDYLEMLEEFETKKRMTKPSSVDIVTIRIPIALQEMFRGASSKPLSDEAVKSKYKNKVQFVGDKLRKDADLFKSFFCDAVRDITAHVRDLMDSLPTPVKAILMVGGFSESPVLQKAVKDVFQEEVEVIIPLDASLCIMKGAVLFGHQPSKITERICRFTYGLAMVVPFDEKQHPKERKIEIDGETLCNDVFDKHVKVGQTVVTGEAQSTGTYSPMSAADPVFPVVLFKSTNPDPQFVDDRDCESVGYYLLERTPGRTDDSVNVRLIFGSSDIVIESVKSDGTVNRADFRMN